jgi:hypothetical protein
MTPQAEVYKLQTKIAAIGREIERHKARLGELLIGKIALDRKGARYEIDKVRVYAGGLTYWVCLEGPLLKKDGTHHARTRCSNPIQLLVKIAKKE